ncbi:MAG: ExbD/TolR family protein [Candidatus Acidiferrales bacterium]
MGMAVGGKKGLISDMNIVPLIDVLLVLLIIFMVITPLTPKGLEALVPQPPPPGAEADPDLQAKTVVVQVQADGKLKINQEDSSWATLGPRLEEIFKTRAERIAFIKGEDTVLFQDVARAIDIMRESGIEKVGLMTAKVEAGE